MRTGLGAVERGVGASVREAASLPGWRSDAAGLDQAAGHENGYAAVRRRGWVEGLSCSVAERVGVSSVDVTGRLCQSTTCDRVDRGAWTLGVGAPAAGEVICFGLYVQLFLGV